MIRTPEPLPTTPAGFVLWYRAHSGERWERVAMAATTAELIAFYGIGGRSNGQWTETSEGVDANGRGGRIA